MEFLNDLLGGVASVASGGLFGLFGSIVGVVGKYFQEKQRQNWELKKMSHELKLIDLQMTAKSVENEQELAIVTQEGSWMGLDASLKASRMGGSTHKWVNDVRSLFRLVLTTGLIMVVVLFFGLILRAMDTMDSRLLAFFTPEQLSDMVRYIVYSMVFSAATATVWWFGDRALTPPNMKAR